MAAATQPGGVTDSPDKTRTKPDKPGTKPHIYESVGAMAANSTAPSLNIDRVTARRRAV